MPVEVSTRNTTAGVITRATRDCVEWERWHAAREADLATAHGWLSLTGLSWLTWQPSSVTGVPGQWWSDGTRAWLGAVASQQVRVDDTVVDGIVTAEVEEGGSLIWASVGQVRLELVRRGGQLAVRTRDPGSPVLQRFAGVPTYAYDPAWIVTGHYAPHEQPRELTVATAQPGLEQTFVSTGAVTVTIDGRQETAEVSRNGDGTLRLPFHDATNGAGTAPWRVVTTTVPDATGSVEIDLNRAVNLPFAFSAHGTCPAPPRQNTFTAAITAGERSPA